MSIEIKKENLIYERVKRRIFYYKDYELVLKGKKSFKRVISDSALQSKIKNKLSDYLENLIKEEYILIPHPLKIAITEKSYRVVDMSIYKKEDFEKIKDKEYVEISPLVAFQVDIKAKIKKAEDLEYVYNKIMDLFNMQTIRVIWIFTSPKIILEAQKNQDWFIKKWKENIEVIDGIYFNLKQLLKGDKK
ncbi:MAG: hypothetical protein ABIL89_04225 [candidate division WOR-3 bacterium]